MDEEEKEEMEERLALKRVKRPDDIQQECRRAGISRQETEEHKNSMSKTLDKNKAKAVFFVPYTVGSTLAKTLRDAEENLRL